MPPEPSYPDGRPSPAGAVAPVLDPESAEWVAGLGAVGSLRQLTQHRLHDTLVRIARAEITRRSTGWSLVGPERDDLAYEAASDAMLAIVAKLDDFRGESRFSTWAYRFVILEVSSKLGRHFWRRPAVVLDDDAWERLPSRFGIDPSASAEAAELVTAVRAAVEQQLSPHQRAVFVAIVLDGVPLDALAIRLETNRNALYKVVFDARRKIRAALVAGGHLDDGVHHEEGKNP